MLVGACTLDSGLREAPSKSPESSLVAAPAEATAPTQPPPAEPPPAAESASGTAEALEAPLPVLKVAPSDGEVYAVIDNFYVDFAKGDWSALTSRFWQDGSVSTVRRREVGGHKDLVSESIESCVQRLQAQVARAKPLEISLESLRIDPVGAVAHALVSYRATDRSGDAPQQWRGTDAFTLAKVDGVWRIAYLLLGASTFDL